MVQAGKLSKDFVTVITGGSGGIGKVIARKMLELGSKVVLVGRSKKSLDEARKDLASINLRTVTASVEKWPEVSKFFKKLGRVDMLVNAAGVYGPIGKFGDSDLREWSEAIQINLIGTANCIYAVLPQMVKRRQGKIVNFSGGGAVQPFPNFSAYAISKAAVVRFTENLAVEYKDKNIQCNSIAPGAVNTKFLERVMSAGKKNAGEEFYKKSLQQKASGGDSPELAADLVAWLSNPKNKLTGKLISAKWDEWKEIDPDKVNKSNLYTLRRIDNQFYEERKK